MFPTGKYEVSLCRNMNFKQHHLFILFILIDNVLQKLELVCKILNYSRKKSRLSGNTGSALGLLNSTLSLKASVLWIWSPWSDGGASERNVNELLFSRCHHILKGVWICSRSPRRDGTHTPHRFHLGRLLQAGARSSAIVTSARWHGNRNHPTRRPAADVTGEVRAIGRPRPRRLWSDNYLKRREAARGKKRSDWHV